MTEKRLEPDHMLEEIESLGIDILRRTYETREQLGEKGLEKIQKNQYGETALAIDIALEKTVIDRLKSSNFPIRVISEEHGIIDIVDGPKYLGVLDGLDGSNGYKAEEGKSRAGTMLGIFSNLDPVYEDYLFCGLMEHSTNHLYFASKNRGAFLVDNSGKTPTPIHTSQAVIFDQSRIYVDFYPRELVERDLSSIMHMDIGSLSSSAAHYVDLASGNVDLVIEYTRKRNLELATAYGLVKEAGGAVVTKDGVSIGKKKYWEFGQVNPQTGDDPHFMTIAAANEQFARDFIRILNSNK